MILHISGRPRKSGSKESNAFLANAQCFFNATGGGAETKADFREHLSNIALNSGMGDVSVRSGNRRFAEISRENLIRETQGGSLTPAKQKESTRENHVRLALLFMFVLSFVCNIS